MGAVLDGISADVMQGNLEPGREMKDLSKLLLSKVGAQSKLKNVWITTCGTMANEIALKIIRQKKAPATKIFAFEDCFCGRSTAMQEITDSPKYREGQPVYGEVAYLPFYDPKLGLQASIDKTLKTLHSNLSRYPGKFAALMIEPVQGEGGFKFAPRDYYVALFDEVKKSGLALWLDEIQTVGRTGELFAYQTFGLEVYPDVVTAAKMLQSSVVLFSEEYAPKAGLVAGTFTGSSSSLKASIRILEMLEQGKYFGPSGKVARLSLYFKQKLEMLAEGTLRGKMSELRILGGMVAFRPFNGTLAEVKDVLMALFDLGAVAFYCGHDPYLIRMLPAFGVMDESHIDQACDLIEKAILRIAMGPK